VGVAADLALAGLSLGTGAALGATVGGIASQGWKPAWALLRQRLQGRQVVRLEDAALCLLARRWLDLIAALDVRGHANAAPQVVGGAADATRARAWNGQAQELLKPLHAAMARQLAEGEAVRGADAELTDEVAQWLVRQLTSPE
jgi:hypothetical protein